MYCRGDLRIAAERRLLDLDRRVSFSGFVEAVLREGLARMTWLHFAAITAALALWMGRGRLPFGVRVAMALILVEAERWAWNGSEYILLLVPVAAIAAIVFRRA